jgi:hypothetical protein
MMLTMDFGSFRPSIGTEWWHEGDSYVHWYAGNYTSYLEDYKKRKGKEADQPHRIKYRKLSR